MHLVSVLAISISEIDKHNCKIAIQLILLYYIALKFIITINKLFLILSSTCSDII